MTIAENIKATYNRSEDWDILFDHCEDHADTIDQDWDNESTQYNFIDGSCILICGSFVSVYNAQK